MTTTLPLTAAVLPDAEAATYAEWFSCLAEPMRVKILHAVATAGRELTIGGLTEIMGISHSERSRMPLPGGMKCVVPGRIARRARPTPVMSPIPPPPRSRSISTACSARMASASPMMTRVGR